MKEKLFFFKYINRSEDYMLSSWLILSPQALGSAAAAGNRRKMVLYTSSKKSDSDSTLQQSVFITVSTGKPKNAYKWVINLLLLFSKVSS